MKKPERSKAELELEVELLRKGNFSNNLTSIVNTLIKYGGLAAIAYFFDSSIAHLAGTETRGIFNFDFNVALNANKYFGQIVAIMFGTSGIFYGLFQRSSKRKAIAHLSKRKEELEKIVDPGRHSSRLMNNGTTRPEDE